jgi:hypothetical protein
MGLCSGRWVAHVLGNEFELLYDCQKTNVNGSSNFKDVHDEFHP